MSIGNSITSIVHELQSLLMIGIHFNIKNLYGNIPRASAAPRLAATFGSSRSAKYFEITSLAVFSPEDTRYVGIKCFNASTAAHWTNIEKKKHSVYKHRWLVIVQYLESTVVQTKKGLVTYQITGPTSKMVVLGDHSLCECTSRKKKVHLYLRIGMPQILIKCF